VTEIKGVIFDLDGVFTDTAEYHYRAWKRLADELGIPFDRQRNEPLRGVSRRRSLELLLDGRPATEEQMQEWMARKNSYYQELIQQLTPRDLLPGALDLLKACRGAGLKIAIASVSRNAATVAERLGLTPLLDALIDGHANVPPKPAPDLFLKAAEALGVPPRACVVVEDAAAGVEAARAAGMRIVGIGPADRVGEADLVVPNIAHLTLDMILQLGNPQAASHNLHNWHITETTFDPARLHHKETVFTIGNGYLGTRGTFEEGYPGDRPATLVHGLFDAHPMVYTELVNLPNWLPFDLLIEGERFRMDRGEILAYRRDLNLRTGVLTRQVRWRSPAGRTVDIYIERFTSLAEHRLAAIRYRVTPLDFEGEIELRAGLDGYAFNPELYHWEPIDQGAVDAQTVFLRMRTRQSRVEVCQACYLTISGEGEPPYTYRDCENRPAIAARVRARPGETVQADKLVALATSLETDDVQSTALSVLKKAIASGYDRLRVESDNVWEREWAACNVTIEGDDEADLALRYSLFQLLIAAPRHTDRASIPAKTLSGFGYRGHVFWDTDIFVLPFFTYTRPELARNLLMYRYHTLDGARRKAGASGFEGAMYAWESADTGDETTPRWVPGPDGELVRIWCGDIEQHISADVAYAVMQYWQITGDDGFMRDYGAEIVLDTARFWSSRVEWNEERGRYEIRDVIGPDEYHEHVDNNAFTNRMARWNLEAALEVLPWLRRADPKKAAELTARLGLTEDRLTHWTDVIRHIHIPYDPETGLIEQFDGYFDLEDINLSDYEPRSTSMQVILGIDGIQRTQVIKQPDVLMLFHLLADEYDRKTLEANWAYYTPRTDLSHGSSLGPAIQALLAARLGRPEEAYEHFMHAARTDLADVRGNAADGIHAAAAGGLWQAIVFGFAGLRIHGDTYTLDPHLPPHWKRLAFTVRLRGREVHVEVGQEAERRRRGGEKGGEVTG
jgi:kojibiose phosphorylase